MHVKRFEIGDEVYILNMRNYEGRCPKWVRSYSYRGIIEGVVNDVTYRVYCVQWKKKKSQVIHVDKLKMRKSRREQEEERPEGEALESESQQ